MQDELGILEAARQQEELRRPKEQDLAIVSRGPAKHGRVQIGSMLTNSIVGKVDVEIVENSVVVTVHRMGNQMGPVSLVVV